MEQKLQQLHDFIKEMFPEAVAVSVLVNCEGILVEPKFRTNLEYSSMKTITGKWVAKKGK